MAEEDFIIISRDSDFAEEVSRTRDGSDEALGGSLTRDISATPQAMPGLAKALRFESASLNEREAADVSRDPNQMAIHNMPVSLIKPMEASASDSAPQEALGTGAGNMVWGIKQVLGDNGTVRTGKGVKVAVLDTGIKSDHPAFSGISNWKRKNFTADAEEDDEQGHGTHCAGTIFGRDIDGKRFGVAQGVDTAIIGKVLDKRGHGTAKMVLDALKWAHSEGANIISMSLGFDFPEMQRRLRTNGNPEKVATSKALKAYRDNIELFRTLMEHLSVQTPEEPGALIVAASGNESDRKRDPNFVIDVAVPAAASSRTVSVGAVAFPDPDMDIASFSNINPVVCAPGVDILSAAHTGGLRLSSGTSMACPHVAGVAALWWEWAEDNLGMANADVVRGRLTGNTTLENIKASLTPADRGAGIVRAPQN